MAVKKRMSKRGNYEIEDLGEIHLPPDVAARAEAAVKAADEELEATRVNFRWGREQLALIKRVAAVIGVPYQTYIKQVLYRQAMADLQDFGQVSPARHKGDVAGAKQPTVQGKRYADMPGGIPSGAATRGVREKRK